MDRAISTPIPSTRSERVARLDDAAFSSFYERTAKALWGYVYRVTGHAADADDIVQEAYCRMLRVEVPSDEEERRRYLYRVTSNLLVDRWRKAGRDARQLEARMEDEAIAPDDRTDPDVARTFASLAARDRALLWLAYVEEESHEEIAASLGVGRRSVKVLLFRAKRRLRTLLTSRGVGV